jgi:ketosteroid isomerase-like protein
LDHDKQAGQADNVPERELADNSAVDDFFTRLKYDMRRPKPGQENISAALQAIQRLALEADTEESVNMGAETGGSAGRLCPACGSQNPEENRFCASCGVPLESAPDLPAAQVRSKNAAHPAGQHYYHHHYHHHYFSSADGLPQAAGAEPRAAAGGSPTGRDPVRLRAPLGAPALSRAEAAVRKLSQDWAHACNTKQLDDLVELYAPDALVLRPNIPPVRGTAAIREFFFAALDSGLGEVEMEPLRVELFGDLAYQAGRCKMLVPVAMGKRREERGKYLIILSRQGGGEWKTVADCWSSDLSLKVTAEPEASRPSAQNPSGLLPRPPHKNP